MREQQPVRPAVYSANLALWPRLQADPGRGWTDLHSVHRDGGDVGGRRADRQRTRRVLPATGATDVDDVGIEIEAQSGGRRQPIHDETLLVLSDGPRGQAIPPPAKRNLAGSRVGATCSWAHSLGRDTDIPDEFDSTELCVG
jgi:hypothetical protein